jgi:hypothetical protein
MSDEQTAGVCLLRQALRSRPLCLAGAQESQLECQQELLELKARD